MNKKILITLITIMLVLTSACYEGDTTAPSVTWLDSDSIDSNIINYTEVMFKVSELGQYCISETNDINNCNWTDYSFDNYTRTIFITLNEGTNYIYFKDKSSNISESIEITVDTALPKLVSIDVTFLEHYNASYDTENYILTYDGDVYFKDVIVYFDKAVTCNNSESFIFANDPNNPTEPIHVAMLTCNSGEYSTQLYFINEGNQLVEGNYELYINEGNFVDEYGNENDSIYFNIDVVED